MAVAARGPAEVISGAAEPGALFPRNALVGVVKTFGIDAVVAYREDECEVRRRAHVGTPHLKGRRVFDLLMNLPLGEPVPVASLSSVEQQALRRIPKGVLTRHQDCVVRAAAQPIRVDLAVVPGKSWIQAKEKAEWFTPFCARAVLLDRPVRRRDDAVLEAEFYGIGLLIAAGADVEVVVPPRPFARRRHTAAAWQFAEESFQQLTKRVGVKQ
ncbi:hypothetical protein ACFV06_16945 [Streptomyces sp. NPDC059618]|uniref:hypothetical protein n=1 Tax=Streptomyces sp. NPDC059618 TaxID=3346887 RepID=UPI0036CBA024